MEATIAAARRLRKDRYAAIPGGQRWFPATLEVLCKALALRQVCCRPMWRAILQSGDAEAQQRSYRAGIVPL